ncbi:MAG: hypothetical protein LUF02_00560 [Erysipelotrichaceae bacterium]|nr:hypothetical protein [Erysipelotrichaceae bacterium]
MKKCIIALVLALGLVGCSSGDSSDTSSNDDSSSTGYVFEVNGTTIQLGEDADTVLEALGDPTDTFEAKSCAFDGYDITYYYSGFELQTSKPEGEDETVALIDLKDDTVETAEGIAIGSSYDDMVAAYGEGEASGTQYVYTSGDTQIAFIIEENEVISITYSIPE